MPRWGPCASDTPIKISLKENVKAKVNKLTRKNYNYCLDSSVYGGRFGGRQQFTSLCWRVPANDGVPSTCGQGEGQEKGRTIHQNLIDKILFNRNIKKKKKGKISVDGENLT